MFPGIGGTPRKPSKPSRASKLGQSIVAQKQEPKDVSGPRIIRDGVLAPPRDIEVLWHGIMSGYSGYAKANREILRRVVPFFKLVFSDTVFRDGPVAPDVPAVYRVNSDSGVSPKVPRITFLPPRQENPAEYRVIYTMMETPVVHPAMIRIMNENYNECWTPTRWNESTFRDSGLRIPIHVVPLGVDQDVYTPEGSAWMPQALRLSGPDAGRKEIPSGFLFIYVCQPTFRKGIDVLLEAFDEAFDSDPDVGLVLGATAYSGEDFSPEPGVRSRIWLLSGTYSERELASIYRSCKAYVCTSLGEGWNMPLQEAAAVGLPVIAPRTSVHPELMPEGHGFFFDADGSRVFPGASKVSPWFEGVHFPDYGPASRRQLVDVLRRVRSDYASASDMGRKYGQLVRSQYTWEASARNVVEQIRRIERKRPG
jgi:glycosyltransferase involved in cell wall biosynthesis